MMTKNSAKKTRAREVVRNKGSKLSQHALRGISGHADQKKNTFDYQQYNKHCKVAVVKATVAASFHLSVSGIIIVLECQSILFLSVDLQGEAPILLSICAVLKIIQKVATT